MRILMLIILTTTLSACGLYEEIPVFGDGRDVCGECGPCNLGARECATGSCVFEEPWAGVVNEGMICEELVFVSREGSDDSPGTVNSPVQTLGRALGKAYEQDAKVVVMLGDGEWEEQVEIREGISILGSVSESLQRLDTRPRIFASGSSEHFVGISIENVEREVTLKGFDVEVEGGFTNYGMRVVGSSSVFLEEMRITAGAGQVGVDGAPGLDGERGTAGANGGLGVVWRGGFRGENEACPEAAGGDGGRGGMNSDDPEEGEESPGGSIGRMGNGQNGFEVLAGADGERGTSSILKDGWWVVGEAGDRGEDGEVGIGGSGGSGGASASNGNAGGGGGGGGAGGCSGGGGEGGTGGGSSIGIIVQDSSLSLKRMDIESGQGGDGGAGGAGGNGGEGRSGGIGSSGEAGADPGFEGGRGSDGGRGGRGGDGRGGNSYSMVCGENTAVLEEDVRWIYAEGGQDGRVGEVAESGSKSGCE